ncbi:Glycerol kinase [Podila epicladia]|nr:Glycerol kinase [Podila epicladia]
MHSFIGAIDNGTTSSRFLIFDENGNLVIGHQLEYRQMYPHPGWVEQDPMDILASVVACIDGALRKFGLQGHHARSLKGIGITNQRETAVVWDRNTGKPLHNAIVWSDTRTKDIVSRMAESSEKGADAVKEACGLPITTYFSAVKLRWLLENSPEVKEAHDNGNLMFGTVDSWLIYWSDECLDFFGLNKDILPEIKPSSTLFGAINHEELDEIKNVPIAGCLGDQHAALVGQHCFEAGEAKNTYGTGCFMLFNTGDEYIPSNNGLLTTVGYQFEGEPASYALEGSIAVAGSAVKWLRDNMGIIREADEINALAASVPDNGGVIFVTAFSGLFAPYWRPDVRGCILGISQHTTKHHLARATLEATCFQTRAILDAMNADSGQALKTLRVDGGLSNSDVCMQLQANILGIDVSRPQMHESTALGAATAAGVHLGIERDEQYDLWQKAIDKSLSWSE